MFSPVASTIFAYRRADKTKNGDVGSGVVAVGQCTGVMQEVAKLDNAFAATAKSAVSVFEGLAKSSKVIDYAGKCLQFTANNVNPLICGAGALKVATSDDKVHTGVTELAALSTMFLGEGMIKKPLETLFSETKVLEAGKKCSDVTLLKPLANVLKDAKISGRVGAVLKGLGFAGTSIATYMVGQKFGQCYADNISSRLGRPPQKINQKT